MTRSKTLRASALSFDQIPNWAVDDHGAALATFARHIEKPDHETYRQAPTGCDPELLIGLASQAAKTDPADARGFFEEQFAPVLIAKTDSHKSIVTGFFEPEYQASRRRSDKYTIPIYARPSQLVDAKLAPQGTVPEGYRFAWRHQDGRLGIAPDRKAISEGALDGQAEVLAWLQSPIDAFFMHIQGAGRLNFDDGSQTRLSYAAKTGHPFTAIGSLLVEMGAIEKNKVSMQSIIAWLNANPEAGLALMNENRSYIFFKETPLGDKALGPVAAAKIQLTALRSLAVDMQFHTFGTPIFVHAEDVNDARFGKLMIAQETGTAIVGPSRGDLFFGTGAPAGELAGGVVSAATFFVLCPKTGYEAYLNRW
ncbi:MAG: MltA domain-containing protein [Pseudomonadota bacterium]